MSYRYNTAMKTFCSLFPFMMIHSHIELMCLIHEMQKFPGQAY